MLVDRFGVRWILDVAATYTAMPAARTHGLRAGLRARRAPLRVLELTGSVVASVIVLVEGESDRAAVIVLCQRLAIALDDVEVFAMGGAMSVGRFAAEARTAGIRAIGLCDAGEVRFFARALEEYLVCEPDLEGEFIRALGATGVERVIELEGDLPAFRTFQNQPFQRTRAVEHQLRRFLGTMSGRKIRYGTLLAAAVELDRLPAPLGALVSALGTR